MIWMAIGVLIYVLYGMRHSMVGRRERGEVEGVASDKHL